jgi:prepilin-type processing-associated H-X9-DG protein
MFAMRVWPQGQRLAWFDQLSPYLGKAKWGQGIFKCPSYKWGLTIPDLGDHPLGIQAGSYAYNAFGSSPVNVDYGDRDLGLGYSTDDPAPFNLPVKESKVKVPSDMYAIGDSPGLFEVNAYTHLQGGFDVFVGNPYYATNFFHSSQVIIQHRSGNNMLFLDAHVEFVRAARLYSAAPMYWRRWNRAHWALGDPFIRGE